jgi:hypothetical protein
MSSRQSLVNIGTFVRDDISFAARVLFFYERSRCVDTLKKLAQLRTKANQSTFNAVVEATDVLLTQGLFSNLAEAVGSYTERLNRLHSYQAELWKRQRLHFGAMSSAERGTEHDHLVSVFVQFMTIQRQAVAESIFFFTYRTQLYIPDVLPLINCIKLLTNGTPSDCVVNNNEPSQDRSPKEGMLVFDPFTDAIRLQQQAQHPFSSHHPVSPHNGPMSQPRDLVQRIIATGQPALTRCVCILVVTVLSAFDTTHDKIDRNHHQAPAFDFLESQNTDGFTPTCLNNLLFPFFLPSPSSSSESIDLLLLLHGSLSKEAVGLWKRADVLGILVAGYAVLLHSSLPSTATTSPRGLSSPTRLNTTPMIANVGNIDFRRAWRECLALPATFKAFTFSRYTLVRALQVPIGDLGHVSSSKSETLLACDNAAFFNEILAVFAAKYFDLVMGSASEPPMSRARWLQDAEADLRIQRVQREQERQFQQWARVHSSELNAVPNEVDLLQRPDCLDDIVAFAVDVANLGGQYAAYFWSSITLPVDSTCKKDSTCIWRLSPSPALLELQRLQYQDESLQASYFSFLASISIVEGDHFESNSAEVVNQMLTQGSHTSASWSNMFDTIWRITRHLHGITTTSSSTMNVKYTDSQTQLRPSTSYYYNAHDLNDQKNALGNSMSRTSESTSISHFSRELDFASSFILLSTLALVRSVASRSKNARYEINGLRIVDEYQGVEEDSAIAICFKLACAPVPPDVRGAVFETIAALIDGKNDARTVEEGLQVIDLAQRGWVMLDACQILPISLFDTLRLSTPSSNFLRFAFPASSLALVRRVQFSYPMFKLNRSYNIFLPGS